MDINLDISLCISGVRVRKLQLTHSWCLFHSDLMVECAAACCAAAGYQGGHVVKDDPTDCDKHGRQRVYILPLCGVHNSCRRRGRFLVKSVFSRFDLFLEVTDKVYE